MEVLRPGRIRRNKGQIDVCFLRSGEFTLSSLGNLLQSLQSQAIFAEVDSGVAKKLVGHPVHDAFINVLTAKESIPGSRQYFEHTIARSEEHTSELQSQSNLV